jgi:hypothetical protein
MTADAAAARLADRGWSGALALALRLVAVLVFALVIIQACIVVQARPQDLITGASTRISAHRWCWVLSVRVASASSYCRR